MTRSTDVAVSLEERMEFANRFSNAVFVSIHFNSGGGSGIESYFLAPDGVPSNASGEHHAAAADTQPNEGNAQDGLNVALSCRGPRVALVARLGLRSRGAPRSLQGPAKHPGACGPPRGRLPHRWNRRPADRDCTIPPAVGHGHRPGSANLRYRGELPFPGCRLRLRESQSAAACAFHYGAAAI